MRDKLIIDFVHIVLLFPSDLIYAYKVSFIHELNHIDFDWLIHLIDYILIIIKMHYAT